MSSCRATDRRPPPRAWRALALLPLLACAAAPPREEIERRAAEPLVAVADVHPRIRFDIRYATRANFTGEVLYDAGVCLLRQSVAERLARVQARLEEDGLGLLVYDGYRPLSVQRKMWALVPDERYVANPEKGSRHNRGAAVDLTLCDALGRALAMPTEHDDFSERAHRDFGGCSPAAARHRALLEEVMAEQGFQGLATEWWHFDAPDYELFPVLDVPLSKATAAPAR